MSFLRPVGTLTPVNGVLTYAVIDDAAEKIREDAVVRNQREASASQSTAVRGRGTRTMNALLQGEAAA
jgi:hypothetical protein